MQCARLPQRPTVHVSEYQGKLRCHCMCSTVLMVEDVLFFVQAESVYYFYGCLNHICE